MASVSGLNFNNTSSFFFFYFFYFFFFVNDNHSHQLAASARRQTGVEPPDEVCNGEWTFEIKPSFPHHNGMEVHLHKYQEIVMLPHNSALGRSFLLSVLREDVSMLLLIAKMALIADIQRKLRFHLL